MRGMHYRFWATAMAATIGGTIKVNVSKGDFAGVYTGDFAYDDTHLTKVGSEFMTINGGNGDLAAIPFT